MVRVGDWGYHLQTQVSIWLGNHRSSEKPELTGFRRQSSLAAYLVGTVMLPRPMNVAAAFASSALAVMPLIEMGGFGIMHRTPHFGFKNGSLRGAMRLLASRSSRSRRNGSWLILRIVMMRYCRRRIVWRQGNVYVLLGGSAETSKCQKQRRQGQSYSGLHLLDKNQEVFQAAESNIICSESSSLLNRKLELAWKSHEPRPS
jgi:hypothetical protein